MSDRDITIVYQGMFSIAHSETQTTVQRAVIKHAWLKYSRCRLQSISSSLSWEYVLFQTAWLFVYTKCFLKWPLWNAGSLL